MVIFLPTFFYTGVHDIIKLSYVPGRTFYIMLINRLLLMLQVVQAAATSTCDPTNDYYGFVIQIPPFWMLITPTWILDKPSV